MGKGLHCSLMGLQESFDISHDVTILMVLITIRTVFILFCMNIIYNFESNELSYSIFIMPNDPVCISAKR